jgi:poly(3-hydroxybutyrate) depolymerase
MTTGGATMGGATGMSAGCGKMPTIASDMYNSGKHIPIMAANKAREYILSVPASYQNTKPYKLIIAYHQLNGDANQMYRDKYYHLQPLSNDTTIFVAPNGQQGGSNCTMASGCGWPNGENSDLALADAMVAQVKENFCIDTNRIFATGWSYGGSMSYKTACERPLGKANGFIRGIAVYSGAQLSGSCKPTMPVAYYGSHGDNDSVLGYDGGVGLAQNFATANTCTWATPTKVTSGNHMCTDVMGCMMGYPTRFCAFDGDHTPDPRDPNQQTSWQYEEVWKFFNQF